MQIKVEVKNPTAREIAGTSGKGKAYSFSAQEIWVWTMDKDGVMAPFPTKTECILEKGQSPHPIGVYSLSPSSLYVGRSGRLEVSPRLAPDLGKTK